MGKEEIKDVSGVPDVTVTTTRIFDAEADQELNREVISDGDKDNKVIVPIDEMVFKKDGNQPEIGKYPRVPL